MSALVLATVMPAIAHALVTAGVVERAYYRPQEGIRPVCAVVEYPEDEIDFDVTFGNGASSAAFPVSVVLGLQQDEATFLAVSAFMNGPVGLVKAAIEGDPTLDALGAIRVSGARIEAWDLGSEGRPLVHTAVRFSVEVTA